MALTSALVLLGGASYGQTDPVMDQTQTQFSTTEAVNNYWQPSLVNDGVYDRVAHINRPLEWQYVREADILWKKRFWREIDTREKQNMAFRYPGDAMSGGGYFIEIMLDAVKKGKVKAYSNMDDRFTTALSRDQIMELLIGQPDTQYVEDPITFELTMTISSREFDPNVVTKYRLKEDWIFDRNL